MNAENFRNQLEKKLETMEKSEKLKFLSTKKHDIKYVINNIEMTDVTETEKNELDKMYDIVAEYQVIISGNGNKELRTKNKLADLRKGFLDF